jgi:hypothetical protein
MTGFLKLPFCLGVLQPLFLFLFNLRQFFFYLKIDNITIVEPLKARYMGEIDRLFKEQEKQEDTVCLKAMLIQILVNLVFTLSVLVLFSWLRPRHAFIYAPKAKLSKYE